MDGGELNDLNDLLVFGERLKLLAKLQGTYLDELRGEGFEDEQAFQLVRDWSNRGFDWTVRWVPPAQSIEDQLRDAERSLHPGMDFEVDVDNSPGSAGPYLLPFDDQDLDQAA